MDKLVTLDKKTPITSSLVISKGTDNEHRSVLRLIKRHKNALETFGVLRFEITKPKGEKGGRPQEVFYLNEQQTTLLLTFMSNSEIIVRFKTALVSDFYRMRSSLMQVELNHQNKEWQQARLDGKAIRKETTNTIKDFLEYAKSQGSKNYKMYYKNITTMENNALFILEQEFDNVREILDNQQLAVIRVVDKMISDSIQEGMERNMHYKDIFKLAKERVVSFATLVKPTVVISKTELKLIE